MFTPLNFTHNVKCYSQVIHTGLSNVTNLSNVAHLSNVTYLSNVTHLISVTPVKCYICQALHTCSCCSIVRMFAQHRDDKKKIEKALEAAQLPTGKVGPIHRHTVEGWWQTSNNHSHCRSQLGKKSPFYFCFHDRQSRLHLNTVVNILRTLIFVRLVNKCMSTHLNANANVSLEANANANAIFQEHMQMFWGCIQMQSESKNNNYSKNYACI